jgi:ribosomal protein S18 acetylase RimI-like enzyme
VSGVTIEEAIVADAELLAAIRRLLPQLSRSAPSPEAYELETMTGSSATQLLIARLADGRIVGTLTLAVFRIPSGVRAWIEDVIVDSEARGHGIGAALCEEAIRRAQKAGARTVDLTSSPTREAANQLYQRLGFEQRETNVYRLRFDD